SEEASALSMMGKLTGKLADKSVEKSFREALLKIKSVLRGSEKDYIERLESLITVRSVIQTEEEPSKALLIEVQTALGQGRVISMRYESPGRDITERVVEPLGLVYYNMYWHLIAWCRLRLGFRDFRTDRIQSLQILDEKSGDHPFDINEYMDKYRDEQPLKRISVRFEKDAARHMGRQKYWFGWVNETCDEQYITMTFLT